MMNELISRTAARLSFGLSAAFLALLTSLHFLEPDFNAGHLISEYQLGDYGFLMSLAFCLLGSGALLLTLSLAPRLRTPGACFVFSLIVAGLTGQLETPLPPWLALQQVFGRDLLHLVHGSRVGCIAFAPGRDGLRTEIFSAGGERWHRY